MNAPPIQLTVSGRAPDEETLLDWCQRSALPVLRALEKLTNGLAQNQVQSVTATTRLDLRTDVVLADASAGALTITPPAAALWERRIIVVKTDATANAVTVQGVNTGVLSSQYAGAEMVCDGVLFYVFTFGGAATAEPEIRVVISSDQNNYSPAGWTDARWVFLNVTAPCNITGLDASATQRRKTLIHVGTEEVALGLYEESLSSAPANRIRTPTPNDVFLLKNWVQDIWYDASDLRWRLI